MERKPTLAPECATPHFYAGLLSLRFSGGATSDPLGILDDMIAEFEERFPQAVAEFNRLADEGAAL